MEKNEDMIETKNQPIPLPSLKRLPVYHRYLTGLKEEGAENVSASDIGGELHFLPIQVRKDIALTGIIGKPKLGWNVNELINHIENFLGWNNNKKALIAGVGSLGASILKYQGFRESGLDIVAGFDINEKLIDKEVNGIKILNMADMPKLIKRMKIKIGIITTPASAAQETAKIMEEAGISAIWNFAPATLHLKKTTIILYESMVSSLAVLSKKIEMEAKKIINARKQEVDYGEFKMHQKV